MNFYDIGELRRGAPKGRGERLSQFESFTELRSNELHQVWLIGNEAIVRMDAMASGPWIVPQARGEAAGGCPAKGPQFNHGAFACIGIPDQLV